MLLIDVRALEAAGAAGEGRSVPLRPGGGGARPGAVPAVSAAVSAARDRESGTLEVLFYGPVDELSYVLGKVGGLLVAYVAALPLLLLSLLLLALLTGFRADPDHSSELGAVGHTGGRDRRASACCCPSARTGCAAQCCC